ncbi:unnamed protein product [Bemisia tabaci]|uniref:TGF-beta family profile domain-containing protein n=1 Tax=Bemisia tabaci TaxID=7038 RepID=A0A9P0C5V8_BEMTA|nr:unnamed protein product [Bemisia tabaci]
MLLHFVVTVFVLCTFEVWSLAEDPTTISKLLETVLKIQPPQDIGFDKSRVRTPDHMMDLLHQYNDDHSSEHLNDNIIRNIFPLQDNWSNENPGLSTLMIFNLTCVQPGEVVYSARLNLDPHDFFVHPHHKSPGAPHKRTHHRKAPLPLQLRVFRLANGPLGLKPVELGLVPLSHSDSNDVIPNDVVIGDVTAYLLDTIASAEHDVLIGFRLETPHNQTLMPKMGVRSPNNSTHRASSFLVVFSEESVFRPFLLPLAMFNTSAESNEIPRSTGKSAPAPNSEANEVRARRSVTDNEVSGNDSQDGAQEEDAEDEYYVFPRKGKGAAKRKKSRAKPHLNDHVMGRRFQDCRRKKLTVNFADIGWGGWVLSPDAFEAYYCDGGCSYPLIRVSIFDGRNPSGTLRHESFDSKTHIKLLPFQNSRFNFILAEQRQKET